MSSEERKQAAISAAEAIANQFGITRHSVERVGLILGTGWGGALEIVNRQELSFKDISGFESLGRLEGHARNVVFGTMGNKEVLALSGRIHLNEGHGGDIPDMVRLQTEMLFQSGVDRLIITSAVGSLGNRLDVGDVAIVESFITLFAPDMPMYAGEFKSPEDMLDSKLRSAAYFACEDADIDCSYAVHAMVRGPFFESRKSDKGILRQLGAHVVGMSMLPEACVASVYGIPVVGLGFVTNDDTEEHSHEENMARAKKSQAKLGQMLTSLVDRI